jgi:hypothetical protein
MKRVVFHMIVSVGIVALSGCATLWHQVLKNSRGNWVEITSVPKGADIYISNDDQTLGVRLDSTLCSSTPCKVFLEPYQSVTLAKEGYVPSRFDIRPTQITFAYWLNALTGAGFTYGLGALLGLPVPFLGVPVFGAISPFVYVPSIVLTLGICAVDILITKNHLIVASESIETSLLLQNEKLAQEGEQRRIVRDAQEAQMRDSLKPARLRIGK